ncbi:uncharacterized protein LOC112051838 isoform X2 [Bicyclus anynana]|nr:uncharacterized protein LOC112051838 isoform X2 [Bicyclus anynana]
MECSDNLNLAAINITKTIFESVPLFLLISILVYGIEKILRLGKNYTRFTNKKMAPCRAASEKQLELLLEFIEKHKNVFLNNLGGGPLARQTSIQKWEEISRKLNSVGSGCNKTAIEWKRYWTLLKSRTKVKAVDVRRASIAARSSSNYKPPLTPIEKRIIGILGKEALEIKSETRIPIKIADPPSEPARCPSPMEEIIFEEHLSLSSIETTDVENTPQWAMEIENKRLESHTKIYQEIKGVKNAIEAQTVAINRVGDLLAA